MIRMEKIDIELCNPKWQELIDSLLKKKYNERPFIVDVYNKIIKNYFRLIDFVLKDDNTSIIDYSIKYLSYKPNQEDLKNYKVIMLGDSDSGKHCIVNKFIENNEISSHFLATIGIEKHDIYFKINDFKIKAEIWDFAGQERFKYNNLRNSDLAIMVYSISSKESFNRLEDYIFSWKSSKDSPFFIIGNNTDLELERVISMEEGRLFSIKKGATYFTEFSSITGENINEIILEVGKCLHQDYIINEKNKDIEQVDSFKLIDEKRDKIEKKRICL